MNSFRNLILIIGTTATIVGRAGVLGQLANLPKKNAGEGNVPEQPFSSKQSKLHHNHLSKFYFGKDEEVSRRKTQEVAVEGGLYKCGEVIATVNPSDAVTFVATKGADVPNIDVITSLIEYGVQVKVVCGSCKTISEELKPSNNEYFEKYCGSKLYGYDDLQSGLVMIPLVEDKSRGNGAELIPLQGTLKGFIHTRATKINRYDIPSQMWDYPFSIEILIAFIATSLSGAISLAPDFMGYGHSESVRSYLVRDAYLTATIPLWMKVGEDLNKETSQRTMLADAVAVEGYSEGGKLINYVIEGHTCTTQ